VKGLPAATPSSVAGGGPLPPLVADALDGGPAVVRLPPAADPSPFLLGAASRGTALVVAPSRAAAEALGDAARVAGASVALLPREWARAAAGARVVVGARAAAFAPAVDLAAVVVIDEHDEALQGEASPTWHARDVAAERARRAGAALVLTSPCPTLEALATARLLTPSRSEERAGWPLVDVVDRRREDPGRSGLYSRQLVDLVRSGRKVVCVLNRKGRAQRLVCAACDELARCEGCGAAVALEEGGVVRCRRCGAGRPAICLVCGGGRLKHLRLGTSRVREDLSRLAGVPVAEVVGDAPTGPADAPVVVGTEAVLHRVARAEAVAFLDLDAELLAPRYRAAEEALALLARAARVVGGRADDGRLLLQTRLPRHEVVVAALHADPGPVAEAEAARRAALRFPPVAALAQVSGPAAAAFVEALRPHAGLELLGPAGGAWLVRAADHATLCDALAATPRPPGRVRVAVDPPRL
jgi:primosomal protein N' (replication factor Y)